jgi:hypothetical protein
MDRPSPEVKAGARRVALAAVYDEFLPAGRLTDPSDGDGAGDDDLAFWDEVERRTREEHPAAE